MAKRKKTNCVYCIKRPAVTRDHVIPRCLFHPPLPQGMITVPACRTCNEAKGRDDDFLRDYLTMDFAGSQSSTAQKIFEGKVRRSVKRNRSEIGRSVLQSSRETPLYTKGGIYLGQVVTAPFDESRLQTVFGRIIRGLYFNFTKDKIPLEYPVKVHRIMPWNMPEVWDGFSKFHLNPTGQLGDVFEGYCMRVKEDVRSTAWLMFFYQRVFVFVSAFNPALAGGTTP